jgi:ATP-binding cassette subfamily B (MDR/TAP) protein 1
MVLQYLTTTFTCLALAFIRSYSLTLVILSAVPILVLITAFSQKFAATIYGIELRQSGVAATLVDRAVTAISTVKAFNAQTHEQTTLDRVLRQLRSAAIRLNALWGVSSGISHFVMMGMFVQGFWFGSTLVRSGKATAGDVMAVFWACLIATSNLQMCIPQLVFITKGKYSMASLLSLVDSPTSQPGLKPAKNQLRRTPTHLKKITPTRSRFAGELAMFGITFAYPSRPSMPVLTDVTLFLLQMKWFSSLAVLCAGWRAVQGGSRGSLQDGEFVRLRVGDVTCRPQERRERLPSGGYLPEKDLRTLQKRGTKTSASG